MLVEGLMGLFVLNDLVVGMIGLWYINGIFGLMVGWYFDIWGKNWVEVIVRLGMVKVWVVECE